jgi:hypothetical protein
MSVLNPIYKHYLISIIQMMLMTTMTYWLAIIQIKHITAYLDTYTHGYQQQHCVRNNNLIARTSSR